MSTSIRAFSRLVVSTFQHLAKGDRVFVTGVEGDDLYTAYLAAFPEGTNPLFRNRTEHDCATCKQFIRRAGSVVTVGDTGKVSTVWDDAAERAPHPYNVVAAAMRDAVLARPIVDLFRVSTKETSFGAAVSRSQDKATQVITTWDHLHTGEIPRALRVASPGEVCGSYRTTVEVFARGLAELSPEAVESVRELIAANALYRGEEYKRAVEAFQTAQCAYLALGEADRRTFVWTRANDPAARFRNTVIGTLVVDLSAGVDLESAVRSFESKVAPQNYKRPTAIITPGMVAKAMETIRELDLESALERRLARITDISVGDVLWVDGAARPLMKGGVEGLLMAHVQKTQAEPVDTGAAEQITMEYFMTKVLPTAKGVEIMFKREHFGNLMVLTAPKNPEPKHLFRWDNDFAWSYAGNVADSIAERVKKAGGKVEGASLRVSLSWSNYDDLDLHIYEPAGRGWVGAYAEIYYGHRRGWTGGVLDVDMNAGMGRTREPVENIVWTGPVPDGAYRVEVHNYTQRETSDPGFVVEVENVGKLSHFSLNSGIRDNTRVTACVLHMRGGVIERVDGCDHRISGTTIKQTKWGLTTEQFVKVSTITRSPNYWGNNAVGNRHTFFVLDGCVCDEEMRGFYGEFLHPRLEPHRKVFEVIGDKTKSAPSPDGLAGLGFSSTKRDSVIIRVRGEKSLRTYHVNVG